MLFYADKCKRLHVVHSYSSVNNSDCGVETKNFKTEKDWPYKKIDIERK